MLSNQVKKEPIFQQNVFIIVLMVVFFSFFTICAFVWMRENKSISVKSIDDFMIGELPNDSIKYSIDEYQQWEDGLHINGWCVKLNERYKYYNYGWGQGGEGVYNNLHIGFIRDEQVYVIPTKLLKRDDVNQLINDGTDYGYCGFNAFLPNKYLNVGQEGKPAIIWKKMDGSNELYPISL